MPKKLRVSPNERIDLPDFQYGTATFPHSSDSFLSERALLSRKALVLEGFRVEIADQSADPGQITVYNGNAFDRDGNLLNNEDTVNDSRTITLSGASTTFYVEVERVEQASDVDARGFWDPTYDNTDPIPDGKEFSINVATRTASDWQIVTPVSTSGFARDTDPSSLRIPVIVLSTNASNEISNAANPGLTQVVASSNLEEDVTAGSTKIRILDPRLFADTGSIVIGQGLGTAETRTVVDNDREHGILTVSVALTNNHDAGEIVRVSGVTARFVQERTSAIPVSADRDRRLGMFQGDELRGSAVMASKETVSSKSDLNLRNLKDHVDGLASIIREMKFNTSRTTATNNAINPPTVGTGLRYYDYAGSIVGTKVPTYTIGDGVNSLGDFNGTTQAPFVAAVAALAGAPGMILVKQGTYTFASTVTLSDNIKIAAPYRGAVSIVNNTSGVSCFTTNAQIELELENLNITDGTANYYAIQFPTVAAHRLTATDCRIDGVNASAASGLTVHATRVDFRIPTTSTSCISGAVQSSSFRDCEFTTSVAGGAWLTASAANNTCSDVLFDHCTFTQSSAGAAPLVLHGAGGHSENVTLQNCTITINTSAAVNAISFGQIAANTSGKVLGCRISVQMAGTTAGSPGVAVLASASANNGAFYAVDNFLWCAVSDQHIEGIHAYGQDTCVIRGNYLSEFYISLYVESPLSSEVTGNVVLSDGTFTAGAYGIYVLVPSGGTALVTDNNCHCSFDVAGDVCSLINVSAGSASSTTVSNNKASCSTPNTDTLGILINADDSAYAVASGNLVNLVNATANKYVRGLWAVFTTTAKIAITGNNIHCQSAGDAEGVIVEATGDPDLSTDTRDGVVISSNRVAAYAVGSNDSAAGIYCSLKSFGCTIVGNSITWGATGTPTSCDGISVESAGDVAIGNNTLVNAPVGNGIYGIRVEYPSGDTQAVSTVAINGNTVRDWTGFSGAGIMMLSVNDNIERVSVCGNVVDLRLGDPCPAIALYLDNGTSVAVSGNSITWAPEITTSAIYVVGSTGRPDTVAITGNTVRQRAASTDQGYGIFAEDCDYISIVGNMVYCGSYPIRLETCGFVTVNSNTVQEDVIGTELTFLTCDQVLYDNNHIGGTVTGTVNTVGSTNLLSGGNNKTNGTTLA